MEFIIRALTDEDYPAVDAMMRSLHGLHTVNRPDIFKVCEHVYEREDFARILRDENSAAYIAEVCDKPAGICIAAAKTARATRLTVPRTTLYLDDFYVLPEYRRRGIGRALIARLEEEGRSRGTKRIDLMVWGFNEPARKFYEGLGMATQRVILEKEL